MPENKENKLYLTNNYSIVSKYSAVRNRYFEDPILEDFVENWLKTKAWRRAPIVNRGYAARLLAMDWAVDRILRCHNVGCAIILGAGYDMTCLRRVRQTCWIEVDLPQVVQVKIDFIKAKYNLNSEDVKVIDGSIYSIESLNYHLISCDICNTNALRNRLDSVLKLVNRRMDVAIINEVCLCYINIEYVENILKAAVDSVRDLTCRAHYIGYEQMNPNSDNKYFSNLMLNHFSSLGHPLKYYPTTQELMNLFKRRLSFQHLTAISMHNVFHNILNDQIHDHSGFSTEPFDEFEEMDLYLAHYGLVMATLVIRDPFTGEEIVPEVTSDEIDLCEDTNKYLKLSSKNERGIITNVRSIKNEQLRRFGHSSCMLTSNSVLISGGFGTPVAYQTDNTQQQQHARVPECAILEFRHHDKDLKPLLEPISLENFPVDQIRLDRMHGQVSKLGDGSLLFFNGGRQGPGGISSKNQSFVATIDSVKGLTLVEGLSNKQRDHYWRHKQVHVQGKGILQIGGISTASTLTDPIIMWDFSSSKFGCAALAIPKLASFDELACRSAFLRHSFGLDLSPNESSLFIWGGLQSLQKNLDKPVDHSLSKLLWDMRANTVVNLSTNGLNENVEVSSNCYGSNIHFISDTQVLRIGGIDSTSGLEFGWSKQVELFDLRNFRTLFTNPKIEGNHSQLHTLTNATSCKLDETNEVVTIGGGGNYFTFGTYFQDSHLIYKYVV